MRGCGAVPTPQQQQLSSGPPECPGSGTGESFHRTPERGSERRPGRVMQGRAFSGISGPASIGALRRLKTCQFNAFRGFPAMRSRSRNPVEWRWSERGSAAPVQPWPAGRLDAHAPHHRLVPAIGTHGIPDGVVTEGGQEGLPSLHGTL